MRMNPKIEPMTAPAIAPAPSVFFAAVVPPPAAVDCSQIPSCDREYPSEHDVHLPVSGSHVAHDEQAVHDVCAPPALHVLSEHSVHDGEMDPAGHGQSSFCSD